MKITLDISDASLAGLQVTTDSYNVQNSTSITAEEYVALALLEPYAVSVINIKKRDILQKLQDLDLVKLEAVKQAVDAEIAK